MNTENQEKVVPCSPFLQIMVEVENFSTLHHINLQNNYLLKIVLVYMSYFTGWKRPQETASLIADSVQNGRKKNVC